MSNLVQIDVTIEVPEDMDIDRIDSVDLWTKDSEPVMLAKKCGFISFRVLKARHKYGPFSWLLAIILVAVMIAVFLACEIVWRLLGGRKNF